MSLKNDASQCKLKVIQSGTGNTEELDIPLSMSLRDLKTRLHESNNLGKINVRHQRIFFLGRELKTSGRSLANLGVGALGVHVLHLHSSKPRPTASARQAEITIDDDDDDDDVVEILDAPAPSTGNNNNNNNNNKRVVELLDDDDEVSAPVAASSTRRKRRR